MRLIEIVKDQNNLTFDYLKYDTIAHEIYTSFDFLQKITNDFASYPSDLFSIDEAENYISIFKSIELKFPKNDTNSQCYKILLSMIWYFKQY